MTVTSLHIFYKSQIIKAHVKDEMLQDYLNSILSTEQAALIHTGEQLLEIVTADMFIKYDHGSDFPYIRPWLLIIQKHT